MSIEMAIRVINDLLELGANITVNGNELKCWIPDMEEGGLTKAYLNAKECFELAEAFTVLAEELLA